MMRLSWDKWPISTPAHEQYPLVINSWIPLIDGWLEYYINMLRNHLWWQKKCTRIFELPMVNWVVKLSSLPCFKHIPNYLIPVIQSRFSQWVFLTSVFSLVIFFGIRKQKLHELFIQGASTMVRAPSHGFPKPAIEETTAPKPPNHWINPPKKQMGGISGKIQPQTLGIFCELWEPKFATSVEETSLH